MVNATDWVCNLDKNIQKEIMEELFGLGLNKEDVENGMTSRICDLQDTIDIYKYLN